MKGIITLTLFCFTVLAISTINCEQTACQRHREREQSPTNKVVGRVIPECDANGDYMPLQCHGTPAEKKRFCQCWTKTGDILTSPSTKLRKCNCHLDKSKAKKSDYTPSCAPDGSYAKQQCDTNGLCWCSDENGKVLSQKNKGSASCN